MIISNVVQLIFYVTPIFWKADSLGNRQLIALVNPFYHFIEIVREPMLGHLPTLLNYEVCAGVTVVGTVFGLYIYGRFRHLIPLWL
jgi:ABC-2 type transport system permease protein/lipopolysaccharide transport system permease protein